MPAHRRCPIHGDLYLGHGQRCPTCRALRYDHNHNTERRQWEPIVSIGNQPCARDPSHNIDPNQPWHLDHLDDGTRRPSCAHHNIAATRNITT